MIRAIGFDLGDTLIEYRDVPLSWEQFYEEALINVLRDLNVEIKRSSIDEGVLILTKYNTRKNPRLYEVSAYVIWKEIIEAWGLEFEGNVDKAISSFFMFFQRKRVVFEDVIDTLTAISGKKIKVGLLTDVPYGMIKSFVMKDIEEFEEYLDCILSSEEVGFRKPSVEGYKLLSEKLGVLPSEMMYVGNESKDIIGANQSGMISVFLDRKKSGSDFGQHHTIERLGELVDLI